MNKIKILIGLLLMASFAEGQIVVPRSPASIHAVDARLEITRNAIIPRYNDTTQANTDLGKDSIGALITLRPTGQVYVRSQISGVKYWKQLATLSSTPIWGTLEGDINAQLDLMALFNSKQNLITLGNTNQYFDGTLSLRTFPTLLSQFSNDPGYITGIVDSASIVGSGKTGSALRLSGDVVAPGANKMYATDGSGVKGWYNAGSGGGTGGPDTVSIVHRGAGYWNVYATGSSTLYDKTDSAGYGISITNKSDSSKRWDADTTSANGLVGKPRLAALNIPVITNLGTGYREYIPGSGVRSFFTSYAFSWDSTSNTNGLTPKIDTNLMATRAYVLGHGGAGGGGPDTVTLNQQGAGYQMLTANSTSTLNTRTITKDYGILLDTTLSGRPLNIGADTVTAHGLVSKDRLNGVIISATGHPKPSYGTYVNSDSVKTDTSALKAKFVGTIIVGDSTYDNAPTITQAIAIAASLGIRYVELPEGSINIKSNWTPKSGVWLKSSGRGTIIRGNFTSDHYLFNYNSATPLNDIGFDDITWDRRGPNVSHGWMGGNVHYVHFNRNRFVDNDTTAAGGALGISAFSPWATYPSDHIYVDDCEFIGSGNFSFQAGNADWVYVRRPRGFRNYREFMGAEPYDLGGEGGKVRHMYVTDGHNYNPDNTVANGSATGVYIITGSSGGQMDDIVFTNCVDSGGVLSSMHGFHVLTGNNVSLVNCRSVFTGGYGFQVTSSAYGESRYVHLINCYAGRNGRDGTRNAGLRVHDTQFSDFDIISEGNTYGFIEDGTSQLNKFSGNVANNTNTYSLNTGRPHYSAIRDLITDSLYPRSTVLAYADSAQGSRIVASRGTSHPALVDIKTGDSLYLKKGDTLDANLEKVMHNSSVLTTGHVVYHIGHDYYFYGGPKNPLKLGNGAMFVNQGLFGTTQSNPVGSLQFVDSAGGGVGEHLWYRGNRTAPYDLLAAAAGGPYFNDFAIIDSGGQHIGFKLRFSDGSYANKIIFPYAAGSTGGGGSSFTLTTTGTSGPATFSSGVLNIPQYTGGGGGSGTSAGFLGDLQYSDGAGGFLSGAMNYSSTQTSLNVPHYASNGASAFITSRGTNVSSGSTANGTDVTTEFTVVTTGAVSGTLINYSYNTATNGRPFAVISASNAATATAISGLFVETLTSTTGRIGFSCASAGTYKVTIHTDFF